MVDLVHFAAQSEDNCGRNVRVNQDSAESPAELVDVRSHRMSAPLSMRKRDHTVHSRRQRRAFVASRDRFGGMRRAITCRDHRDLVPRSRRVRLPARTKEGRHRGPISSARLPLSGIRSRASILQTTSCAYGRAARRDRELRAADRLAVWKDHFAGSERARARLYGGGMASLVHHSFCRRCVVRSSRESVRARWRRSRTGAVGSPSSRRWEAL